MERCGMGEMTSEIECSGVVTLMYKRIAYSMLM